MNPSDSTCFHGRRYTQGMWFVYMFSCTIWLGHNFTHLQQNRPPTLRELSIGEGSWNLFLLKLYKRVWVNIWRRPPTLYRWTVRINKPPPSFLVGDGACEPLKLCCKELDLQTDEAKSRWVQRLPSRFCIRRAWGVWVHNLRSKSGYARLHWRSEGQRQQQERKPPAVS